MNRAIVALVGIVVAGCAEQAPAKTADAVDAGSSVVADGDVEAPAGTANPSSGGDGGGAPRDVAGMTHAACLAAWQPLDGARKCLGAGVVTPALCVTEPATHKGLYALCAYSPSHEAYFKEVTQPVRANAAGWTFAPQWLADLLGLPPASAADAATCDIVLASNARPALPNCP